MNQLVVTNMSWLKNLMNYHFNLHNQKVIGIFVKITNPNDKQEFKIRLERNSFKHF